MEKAQGGTSGGRRCRGQGTVRRGGGDGLEGTRGDQGPPGAWAGGWVWGRVVSGHQRAERGDRRLRARETGRLGESSAAVRPQGRLPGCFVFREEAGPQGEGTGTGSWQQRSTGSEAGVLPPGSPGSCRQGCRHPQKLLLSGPLVPRPLPRALCRKGPSLPTALCLAPSSAWQAPGDPDERVTGLADTGGGESGQAVEKGPLKVKAG